MNAIRRRALLAMLVFADWLSIISETIRQWAWSRYWYGPKGIGTEHHPHLASVRADSWRQAFRTAHYSE